jgi:hypothetical protein
VNAYDDGVRTDLDLFKRHAHTLVSSNSPIKKSNSTKQPSIGMVSLEFLVKRRAQRDSPRHELEAVIRHASEDIAK